MLSNKKQVIIFAAVICLVFGISLYKFVKVENNNHFQPSSPGSLYYAEAAYHYRYADIAAKSKSNPFDILSNDTAVQYPEKINVFKYETVMMELFYGLLYRLANFGLPFNLFLILTSCFFSSLVIIGVFLIARRLCGDNIFALAAALFYATTPASYLRTAAGSFLREDFALVFLMISILFIILQIEGRSRPILSISSGVLVVFSLSSWHFNQFIYICMLPFFCWIYVTKPEVLKNFFYTFLLIFAAGLVIPVLNTSGFATSLLMCGIYAILLAYLSGRKVKGMLRRSLLLLFIFAATTGALKIISGSDMAYSHVFDMFMEKIKFFFKKPDDPSLLSFSARQLWESAFNTPDPGEVWWLGRFVFPLGLIGSFILLWKERRSAGAGIFIASLTIIFFLLSIMAKRILVVAAPFAAIAICGFAFFNDRRHYLKYVLCGLIILNSLGLTLSPVESGRFTPSSYSELFKWIDSNTRPDDAIVAHIHVSPMILLNTGRPEILHPKFENLPIRKRYEEFITAMYSRDEKALFQFCKKYGARYLVYDWGFFITDGKDSMRYLGLAVPDISEKAMASRLHFSDTELRHFRPVFRNSAFMVYEVAEGSGAAGAKSFPYSPIYDENLYKKEDGSYKNTRQTYDTIIIPYAEKVNMASGLLARREAFLVVDLLKPLVEKIPRGSEAVFLLAQAYVQLGQFKEAEMLAHEYLDRIGPDFIDIEPLAAKIMELLADTLYYQGHFGESFDSLTKSLETPFHTPDVYKKMAILKKLENKTEEADKYLKLYEESSKHRAIF